MIDLRTVMKALSRINDAIDTATLLNQGNLCGDSVPARNMFAGLVSDLTQTKKALVRIKKTLLEQDEQRSKLQQAQDVRQPLLYKAPFYWLRTGVDGDEDGPFCQQCYDGQQQLMRLHNPYGGARWVCTSCNSQYFEPPDPDEKDYYCFCSGE